MKKTKRPFEKDWTKKLYTYEEIEKFISKGENYGVLCGIGGLAVIDSDNPELQKVVEKELPETLRVRTGSGGTHNYYFIPALKSKIIMTTTLGDREVHWGEVQSHGTQVIGPGSVHPNGNLYEIINNTHIAEINLAQLTSSIKPFRKEVAEIERSAVEDIKTHGNAIDDLSVEHIWGASMKKQGSELYGPHPVHGSDSGANFWINPIKNTWHCFRCDSGGGPLSAIAVKEGLISCSDAKRGFLRGEKVLQALRIAREKYGLVDVPMALEEELKPIAQKDGELELWNYKMFKELKKDTNFLVDQIIYPKTVTMIYSPPGEFKSILALYMGMCIASGKPWLGFETKVNSVLYCDKENNDQIIKERLQKMFRGQKFDDEDFPLFILRRNGDLLDNKFIKKLKVAIETNNIKIIFLDTMHRFADYDENRSDDINRLYSYVFQPLVEEFGVSIVFLHHTKKDGGYRGSGDFLGMVDTAYSICRQRSNMKKDNRFRMVNEKCRSGEIEEVRGEIDFDEDFMKILRLDVSNEEEKDLGVLKRTTVKVRQVVRDGEELKRGEIMDRLELEDFSTTLKTVSRSLKWLVDNRYFNKVGVKYSQALI